MDTPTQEAPIEAQQKFIDEDGDALPWFLRPSTGPNGWLEADVNLVVFNLGYAHLVDATEELQTEWARCAQDPKLGYGHPTTVAKLFAAYVDHCDSDAMPKRGDGWLKWDTWAKKQHHKIVKRLADACLRFMRYVGDSDGSTVPNS